MLRAGVRVKKSLNRMKVEEFVRRRFDSQNSRQGTLLKGCEGWVDRGRVGSQECKFMMKEFSKRLILSSKWKRMEDVKSEKQGHKWCNGNTFIDTRLNKLQTVFGDVTFETFLSFV